MGEHRSQRIEFLKRENRRRTTAKSMSRFIAGEFLPQNENDRFCERVFARLAVEKQSEINEGSFEANTLKAKCLLEQVIKDHEIPERPARFLVYNRFEVEAVGVNALEILRHVELASEICGFDKGMFDFVLVAEDLRYGVCVEKGEYVFCRIVWGLA